MLYMGKKLDRFTGRRKTVNDVEAITPGTVQAMQHHALEVQPLSKLMDLAAANLKDCKAVRTVGIHPDSGKYGVTVLISWEAKEGKHRIWETGTADQADAVYARALCRALTTEHQDLDKLMNQLLPVEGS